MAQFFNSISEFMHAASCGCPMCKSKMCNYEYPPAGVPIDVDISFNKSAIKNPEDKNG